MIDLFGLRKQQEPGDEPASTPSTEGVEPVAPAPRGSHKLWAFLLVLDSVFVIVFAGAVAAKVYQHWKTPPVAAKPVPRKRPAKPVEAPAAPAAAAPAPAPEPAKAPETPKPASDAPRPPKPSMTTEAPRHRETPKLADAAGKPPAAAPANGKVKALKTEFKVQAPRAKSVELVGAFIVRGGRKDMIRQGDGSWTITLYLNPGTYRYFFAVDKKKQLDPENPLSDKSASLLTIP